MRGLVSPIVLDVFLIERMNCFLIEDYCSHSECEKEKGKE